MSRARDIANQGAGTFGSVTADDLTVDTTTLVVDETNNRVGIGTASPDARLNLVSADDLTSTDILRISSNNELVSLNFGYDTIRGTAVKFATNGTTAAGEFDSSQNFKFNSGYGSVATAYGVRAWVNYEAEGEPSIRGSGNVSSITDDATGTQTVNLTTAMPDTNYSAVGQCSYSITGGNHVNMFEDTGSRTTSGTRFITSRYAPSDGAAVDVNQANMAIIR